jgi:hypothetical protein
MGRGVLISGWAMKIKLITGEVVHVKITKLHKVVKMCERYYPMEWVEIETNDGDIITKQRRPGVVIEEDGP